MTAANLCREAVRGVWRRIGANDSVRKRMTSYGMVKQPTGLV